MTKDERLLPLPNELQKIQTQDIPSTYAPVYDEDPFAEKRSIREYAGIILKRKWMLLAIILIATVSTAIYMYRLPSQFQSQAQIVLEPRRPKQVGKEAVYVNNNYYQDINYTNTQIRLMQSPELMRDVVVTLGLHRNPNLFAEPNNANLFGTLWARMTGAKPAVDKNSTLPVLTDSSANDVGNQVQQLTPEEESRVKTYASILIGGLTVEPVEKTNLVNLKFQSTNPDLAVKVPNAVTRVFIAQDAKRETQGAEQANVDNFRSIGNLQQNINALENQRIRYMNDEDLPMGTDKGADLVASRVQEYNTQWLTAEKERKTLQAQYESAANAKDAGAIPTVNESKAFQEAIQYQRTRAAELEKTIEGYNQKISDLQTQRSELSVKYTPEYFAVKQIDEKIKTIEQNRDQTRKEVGTKIESDSKKLANDTKSQTVAAMRYRYEETAKREAQARDSYFRELAASKQQNEATVKLTTLNQEIDTNRKLLDGALQRQKELELAANSSRPDNIKLASDAQNASLVGPQRNRSILIAFLVSLVGGIGLAFLLDYLDDSIKSSDDIGRHLGLATLAMIPHTSLERSASRTRLASKNPATSTALIALEDTRSALAEAYRHLRTSLLFSSAGKPPQTILVTSAQPSEGKTTTAINTAIALAQSGADVVIIDCDLRRPRLHHHFSLDNTHGLTNFLSGERNTSLLIKEGDGRLKNLKVVTSGPIPPNPAELLSSNEMRDFIEYLKGNFKHIVVDSPPAISFTDAAILSTLVDGVVIVAMAGKSSIHLIRRFKQRLTNVGARIYGVVLNGIKKNSLDYNYYGYGYYYSYQDENAPHIKNDNDDIFDDRD
ncbi:MAG: polysaccharide biosynthesis tyrosine autokinase [Pyrinomonadaceae bacterium]|nr:polysaccharide biosynthesis tyrosine autokinase [Pyrinomonadaceae bacterium]